jgi:hypothetical protein
MENVHYDDTYVWNHYSIKNGFGENVLENEIQTNWILPIVYGFVDQSGNLCNENWMLLGGRFQSFLLLENHVILQELDF